MNNRVTDHSIGENLIGLEKNLVEGRKIKIKVTL